MDEVSQVLHSVIHTDYLGANPEASEDSEASGGETTDEEEADSPASILEVAEQEAKAESRLQLPYEVGDFVTALYDGNWLLAQVDINQDRAGDTHVNLSYMEKVGENQFRWPKHNDLLLTLKEDILTRGCTPVMVGSSIRAVFVGLSPTEAQEANMALAAVVYLQSILSKNFLSFTLKLFFFPYFNKKGNWCCTEKQANQQLSKNQKRSLTLPLREHLRYLLVKSYGLGFWVLRIIEDRNFSIRKNKNTGITHMCTRNLLFTI
jgi:hypothetical protein